MVLKDIDRSALADYLFRAVEFAPTAEQRRILDSPYRFTLVAGGEQAGKSLMASKYLLSRFAETEGKGLFWLVAADYERTRAEFEYLVDDFAKLGLLSEASKRVDPGHITLVDGTKIETKSAKDPRTLAMRAPNGILGCEASQLDLETFYRLRGRCAPKRGWLFLSGTFEGSLGWYPQMFTAWASGADKESRAYSLPSYTNVHLYPGGSTDPEILRLRDFSSDDFYMERIEGKPSPPQGLVFPEFRPDAHIAEVEYEEGDPVHLWLDPGYAGAYAVEVVQVKNDQIQVVDEIYEQLLTTEDIIDIAKKKPWWKDVQFGVIDIGGTQHQAMSSPAEMWLDQAGLYMSSQKVRINEGTERLKGWLNLDPKTHAPRLVIAPHCHGILSEFGAVANPFDGQTQVYKWKTDREGNIVGDVPHDKNNHGIKAVIYGLVDRFGVGYLDTKNKITVKRWSR
tara:strand:- start:1701 stop:3059 length:1359 start_codon:yes stop_codon:yes gene_type:complete